MIKEVADVTFYEIVDGKPGAPVLFLDTLKVSTIEETSAQSDATGGKGNAKLISWDHSKELNVTLEDALFSPKSMAIMFGNGNVETASTESIMKSINFTATSTSLPTKVYKWSDGSYKTTQETGSTDAGVNVEWYVNGASTSTTTAVVGDIAIGKFSVPQTAGKRKTITIDAKSFPGTYYIVGDTYARPMNGGKDEFFQFIVYKAKVKCENTITLQADGDQKVVTPREQSLRKNSVNCWNTLRAA